MVMKKYEKATITVKNLSTINVLYASGFDSEGLFGEDFYF